MAVKRQCTTKPHILGLESTNAPGDEGSLVAVSARESLSLTGRDEFVLAPTVKTSLGDAEI